MSPDSTETPGNVADIHQCFGETFCFNHQGLIHKDEELVLSHTQVRDGLDSSVGIVTRHGLDGPGIESRWGRDSPHPSRQALGSTQHPIQFAKGLAWGKSVGAWR
jgi:hypothetical protein